jgi:hypothetical protein
MFTKRFNAAVLFFFITALSTASFSQGNSEFRELENNAFKLGEVLTFDVNYGFVTAGVAEFAIKDVKKISGREAYHITFKVNSLPSFDWFYKVRDRYETYVDVKGIFPWRFEQHIREGDFSHDYSAFFDQRREIAKTSDGEAEISKYVHDIVSAFYYFRVLDLSGKKKGDIIKMQNFANNQVYDLDVIYHGKETVTVAAGTFECHVVEPLVLEGGLFKSEGKIIVYLSNDELKVPVLVKTEVVVGAIDAELSSYKGLAGELSAKKD